MAIGFSYLLCIVFKNVLKYTHFGIYCLACLFFVTSLFVCLMVFNATFNNISVLYRGGQFYLWRKPENPEKTTDLSQIIDKLYHVMLYHSPWSRFGLTSVVIGTDCIGSCKSNYIGSCKSNYHTDKGQKDNQRSTKHEPH
jgi:hypothetical protein